MNKRILFVDDEPLVLQGIKRSMRAMRSEWELEFANSGAEAVAAMTEAPFDVVISDMRMPGTVHTLRVVGVVSSALDYNWSIIGHCRFMMTHKNPVPDPDLQKPN
jgi:YesN/AraC family two-component response regulator